MSKAKDTRWGEFLVLLAVGLAVIYLAVVLPNSIKTDRLRARRDSVKADVEALSIDVDRLAREIEALEGDRWFIERRLRAELNYLAPGEHVFEGKPKKMPKQSRAKAPSKVETRRG